MSLYEQFSSPADFGTASFLIVAMALTPDSAAKTRCYKETVQVKHFSMWTMFRTFLNTVVVGHLHGILPTDCGVNAQYSVQSDVFTNS